MPGSKGSSEVYDKVTVKLVSQNVSMDYAIKELELSQDKSSETATVAVFHYLQWPKQGIPQGTSGLLQLIAHLNKRQMTTGNKLITIICK